MHHDLVSKLYSVYVGRCQSWETITCSRLRDSEESVNWEKECKKSEGAGERQGGRACKQFLKIVSKRTHEWPRVTTNDHEWPRVTTSDYEWPRVRLHQNSLLMLQWRHHYIILSNNHYFTANWPFLETLMPGFDILAVSDWMGEGLGDGQGGGMGGTNFPPPIPFNLGSRHF